MFAQSLSAANVQAWQAAALPLSTGACLPHKWRCAMSCQGENTQGQDTVAQSYEPLTQQNKAGRNTLMITGRTIFVSYYTPSP
jgi:hypothetical protein